MSFLDYIADPTLDLPDSMVLFSSVERMRRRSGIAFWDDPYQCRGGIPKFPDELIINNFTLKLGVGWSLVGHRLMQHRSGLLISDRIEDGDRLSKFPDILYSTDRDTHVRHDGVRYVVGSDASRSHVHLSGIVGLAVCAEPSNWGSFLTRALPKVFELKRIGCDRILVYCQNKSQRELLSMVGLSGPEIVPYEPWRVYTADSFIFPSEMTNGLYLSSIANIYLSSLSNSSVEGRSGRKVFVSRTSGLAGRSGRYCVNGAQLDAVMAKCGFDVVHPDVLPVSEQIALFSSADYVVGPSGAGLFNSVFMRPGSKLIDIESQTNWLWGHVNLFGSLGLNFGIHWGQSHESDGEHRPYYVNLEALLDRVVSFSS